MTGTYILNKKKDAIPINDTDEWAEWFATADRHVGINRKVLNGKEYYVSTVFLGLDRQHGDGPPLLFETMVFEDNKEIFQDRCSTYEEAEEMHIEAARMVMKEYDT